MIDYMLFTSEKMDFEKQHIETAHYPGRLIEITTTKKKKKKKEKEKKKKRRREEKEKEGRMGRMRQMNARINNLFEEIIKI